MRTHSSRGALMRIRHRHWGGGGGKQQVDVSVGAGPPLPGAPQATMVGASMAHVEVSTSAPGGGRVAAGVLVTHAHIHTHHTSYTHISTSHITHTSHTHCTSHITHITHTHTHTLHTHIHTSHRCASHRCASHCCASPIPTPTLASRPIVTHAWAHMLICCSGLGLCREGAGCVSVVCCCV